MSALMTPPRDFGARAGAPSPRALAGELAISNETE